MKIDLWKPHQQGGHEGVPILELGLYLGLGIVEDGDNITVDVKRLESLQHQHFQPPAGLGEKKQEYHPRLKSPDKNVH
jgi:hypothetical protein